MNFLKLNLIILISLYLCVSCKKECVYEAGSAVIFDIDILNKQDTISFSDSIIFYASIPAENYDIGSDMHYNLNDIKMIMGMAINLIEDTTRFKSIDFNNYFDTKIEIGEFNNEFGGYTPLKVNDSIYYKIVVYPKQSGLFAFSSSIFTSTDEYYSINNYSGMVLARNDKCILITDNIRFVPSKTSGEIDNNNFNMFYNSGFIAPYYIKNNNVEWSRENIYNSYYFVYVE